MEAIRINKNSFVDNVYVLDSSIDDEPHIGLLYYTDDTLYCELKKNIALTTEDGVYFNKSYEKNGHLKIMTSTKCGITEISGDTLTISEPSNMFFINSFDISAKTVTFSNDLNLLPEDIAINDNIKVTVTSGNTKTDIELKGIKCVERDGIVVTGETTDMPEWILRNTYYFEEGIDDLYNISSSLTLYRCTMNTTPYYFIDDDSNLIFYDNTNVVVRNSFYNISLPLGIEYGQNLSQEENIDDLYINDIKRNVIPDTIDMEKVRFSPVYKDYDTYVDISEIEVNFHFRDRNNTGWTVSENTGWNNVKTIDVSDLVSVLNFTDSDIKNQTEKLKRSFARFSYYESKDPMTQMLLTYTTAHHNTGELYGLYTKYRNEDKDYVISGDTIKRIDTKITISDNFDEKRSSEGFYLYLFNNEVDEINTEKDIYLKIEYNHAGYGRTIAFMKPYMEGSTYKGVPLNKFYDNLYIKVKLKYLSSKKKYVYMIDESEIGSTVMIDKDNRKMIINVFEVKLDD